MFEFGFNEQLYGKEVIFLERVIITPTVLEGDILIPPSKSISHRAIICAGLAKGSSRIENLILSEDIAATLEGMKAFGCTVEEIIDEQKSKTITIVIKGTDRPKLKRKKIDCAESGSTLRFLIPLAGLAGEKVTFSGRGKLVERPLETYYELFREQGIEFKNEKGGLPLTVKGLLQPGMYRIRGDISSQFITGLMFLLPLLDSDSVIEITTHLESRGYIDLTIDVLDKFGIVIEKKENYREFRIKGKQRYLRADYSVEGDYSQAAFWLVAGTLAGKLNCKNINEYSLQGDKAILDIIKKMGGKIITGHGEINVQAAKTYGTEIDAEQVPDLVPVLAVLGALSKGTTKIINAGRLRIKESDRLKATAQELNKLGAEVEELADGLLITGKEELEGGTVDSWNDHRIAMAMAVASIRCRKQLIIENSEAVKKSYPHFWEDFKELGGRIQ